MQDHEFSNLIAKIRASDPRYEAPAYYFLREALDFTVKLLDKPRQGPQRHITGMELLEGIRRYALQEFGPMAATVFAQWGIRNTADFGELVFNLVEAGALGKTDQDKREDFRDGYDFFEAFEKPFLPRLRSTRRRAATRRRIPRREAARPDGAA